MIDHILLDVVGALRRALEGALLERLPVEERFEVDVFAGNVTFGTSYGLPGEDDPGRVHAEMTLEWSTWSQSAYRSWSIGEPTAERPELACEVAFRLERLADPPPLDRLVAALGDAEPRLSADLLAREPWLIEQRIDEHGAVFADEVAFSGVWTLLDTLLDDPVAIDHELEGVARFVASALVRLADLNLPTTPLPEDPPAS